MKKKKRTQKEIVLAELKQGHKLTAKKIALKYDIWRLAHWIHVLRKEGYPIVTTDGKSKEGKSYAIYHMERKKNV